MVRFTKQSKPALMIPAGILLSAWVAAAQVPGLCNTGQTAATAAGCTGTLAPPNPAGGGPHRDGNWQIYPTALDRVPSPCALQDFVPAWVDTPNKQWLPNGVSTVSEWIMPYDGESPQPPGWYVYRTSFPVPAKAPGVGVPTGVSITAQIASEDATYGVYLESPAGSGQCTIVAPLTPPVNGASQFTQWFTFGFNNAAPLTPGADAYLYFVVSNHVADGMGGPAPTGLRVEFFAFSLLY
jgi:hypothetical protein